MARRRNIRQREIDVSPQTRAADPPEADDEAEGDEAETPEQQETADREAAEAALEATHEHDAEQGNPDEASAPEHEEGWQEVDETVLPPPLDAEMETQEHRSDELAHHEASEPEAELERSVGEVAHDVVEESGEVVDTAVALTRDERQMQAEAESIEDPSLAEAPRDDRQGRYKLSDVVRLNTDRNPKRPGTTAAEHWGYYRDGMTVQEYLEDKRMDRRRARANLVWDIQHSFVRVESAA